MYRSLPRGAGFPPFKMLQWELQASGLIRPLALTGHVTNASLKQWVGILLTPKIVRAHKNYLTPEIWEETHLREIFYDTLIFQQSSMICIGRHAGGQFVERLIVTLRCAGKSYHIIFSTISLKFTCKMSVQKGVIPSFKNHILVTWPATNLLIWRKWCGFEKLNHYYFVTDMIQ